MGFFNDVGNFFSEGSGKVLSGIGLDLGMAEWDHDYASDEAARSRAFTKNMYTHRHQWEVEDLLAAGLNPILSAHGSPGTPSSAQASSTMPRNPLNTAMQIAQMDAEKKKLKQDIQESISRQNLNKVQADLTEMTKGLVLQQKESATAKAVIDKIDAAIQGFNYKHYYENPDMKSIMMGVAEMPPYMKGPLLYLYEAYNKLLKGGSKVMKKMGPVKLREGQPLFQEDELIKKMKKAFRTPEQEKERLRYKN